MLYRAATDPSGREVENRIVQNADEEQQAQAAGWLRGPDQAVAAEQARQEAIVAARKAQAHANSRKRFVAHSVPSEKN